MVLLGDKAQMEACFDRFGDSVSFGATKVHNLRQMYHRLRKSFWTHQMILLGDGTQMEARFGSYGDCANLDSRQVHDLCRTHHKLRNHFGRN
jgi:hypothetical protein